MIKNNIKLKLIILSIFIVSYGAFLYFITQDKNDRISSEYNQKIKDLEIHYALTIDNFLTDAKSIASIVQNDKKIMNIFSQAQNASVEQRAVLRKQLYNLLLPLYLRIKQKGVHQFHLQFRDNTTFLRMHKPDKFDDDLTDVRYSYKYTNETKKPILGFEQGRSSHAIRYVYPLFDERNNHIGAGEIALSTNYIQDKLMVVNKIHTHFIVDKHIFDVKTWETKHLTSKYIQSVEHKNYMFSLDRHTNAKELDDIKQFLTPLKENIDKNIFLKIPFALHTQFNDKIKILAFLPIKNIKDKKVVAYLVSYSYSKYLDNILYDYKRLIIIVFFIMLIIFYFIYRNLKYKENLEFEIKEKIAELKELNKNLEQKVKNEVKKNRKKDKLISKQSQRAALGEMMDAIAHQWKQPLGVIRLHVQSLSLGLDYGVLANSEDIREVSEKVEHQVEHLISTIDEFRSFFRPNQKQINANIKTIIDETLLLMKDGLIADNIETEILGDEDIELFCLPNEFKHIFINLINNTTDAFIENDIQDRKIIFELKKENNTVIIKISDNAGGIPEDIIDKIFISNFTTKAEGDGTGIGLYLTKQIVEKLHGTIEVCNDEKYKGATFSIIVPT